MVTVVRAAFAANWLLASRGLRRLGRGEDLAAELAGIGQPRLLTTVARLPSDAAEPLARVAMRLGQEQPEHYVYPAEDIHLTILALRDQAGAADEIRSITDRHPPFAIDIGSLNVSPSTVFAELYPRGPALASLRRDLRGALVALHVPPAWWLRQRLAHANVARFAGPVDNSLLARVATLREPRFGRFDVTEIELVRTDKVLSREGTQELGRFPLRGSSKSAHRG